MDFEHPQLEQDQSFRHLSDFHQLASGHRLQTRDGLVYEVRSVRPIIRAEGKDLQTYLLKRIEGADAQGHGGTESDRPLTNTLNWPMDTMLRRVE